MSAARIAKLAAVATGLAVLSSPAFANWAQSLQSLSGLQELSPVIKAACGPNYVPVHWQNSSNTVCVYRATVLPGGPKLKAPTKRDIYESRQSKKSKLKAN